MRRENAPACRLHREISGQRFKRWLIGHAAETAGGMMQNRSHRGRLIPGKLA